jgi:hypothetical protein
MKLTISRTRLWLGLIALVLLLGLSGRLPVAQADGPSRAALDSAIQSTFKVFIIDGQLKVLGGCSATLIDPAGYVLTNFHCVGLINNQKDEGTPGTFYNPQGFVALGPTIDPKKAPVPTYYAKFVTGNYDQDVAVLKIVSMVNNGQPLPKNLPMLPIVRADSESMSVGDYIGAIGYPGVGGNTVTFTDGKVSGFSDWNRDGVLDSFKVTANINPGNSGGLAINEDGEQIGIPTWVSTDAESLSKISDVLMVNFAEPYIQKALSMGGVSSGPDRPSVTAPPAPTPKPNNPPSNPPSNPSSKSPFSNIRFGNDVQNNQVVGIAKSFPAGTTKLILLFDYAGIKAGTDWGDVWLLDDEDLTGDATGTAWDGKGTQGSYYITLSNKGKALPDGTYKVTLYVNGSPVLSGSTSIGKASDNKPQPPPTPSGSGVTVSGQIIDASTQRGISNAAVAIFKPGVTADDLNAAETTDELAALMAAAAFTDKNGNFQITQLLARGYTYPIVVTATGYTGRAFWGGLEITASDPAALKLKPIELQKK